MNRNGIYLVISLVLGSACLPALCDDGPFFERTDFKIPAPSPHDGMGDFGPFYIPDGNHEFSQWEWYRNSRNHLVIPRPKSPRQPSTFPSPPADHLFRQQGPNAQAYRQHSRKLFMQALAIDPSCFEAELNLGILDFEDEDYASCLEHLRRAMRRNPYDPTVHYWMKRYYQRRAEIKNSPIDGK